MHKYLKKALISLAITTLMAGCGADGDAAEKGERAIAKGAFNKAAKEFAEAALSDPLSPALQYNLGVAKSRSGDMVGAVNAFRAARELDAENLDIAEYLAAELRNSGALEESHELLDAVILGRQGDQLARALNSMAATEFAMNHPDLALVRLLQAECAATDYAPTFFNLAKIYGDTCENYQNALAYLERYKRAAAEDATELKTAQEMIVRFEKNPAKAPIFPRATSAEARAQVDAGKTAYGRKKWADAAKRFEEAKKRDPGSYEAALFFAHALFAAQRYDEAVRAYRSAAALATCEFDPIFWMAQSARKMGDAEGALKILTTEAIPTWPRRYEGYEQVAEIYEAMGRTQIAQQRSGAPYLYMAKVFAQHSMSVATAAGKKPPKATEIARLYADAKFFETPSSGDGKTAR